MTFTNRYLSYSRLSRYEQCPLSFQLQYIDKLPSEEGVPLLFGKAVHATLERLAAEHVAAERVGPLGRDRARGLWREAWAASGLSGIVLFQEGLSIVESYVRDQGPLDHRDVLAIEKEFELEVGPFTVVGFIDRVDQLPDDGIEVIDFKTNRVIFDREEVDTSLQLSIYAMAARKLWPWAKHIRLTFWMLRHSLRLSTERDDEQLANARDYIEILGRMTETATEYPARLNANCSYCDHRQQCPAYQAALDGEGEPPRGDLGDLDAVAREREDVAHRAKILYARKSELDNVLKAHLDHQDELSAGGVKYRMLSTCRKSYPLRRTVELLAKATGEPKSELVGRIGTIDNAALERVLKALRKQGARSELTLLELELDAVANKSYSPRLWAKAQPAQVGAP